jgi:biotin carboxyl carrier protein
MPDRKRPAERPAGGRTPAQREADHASLARLSETLLPALVEKLASSGLGEVEVHEGSWRVRLRRPPSSMPVPGRRGDWSRSISHGERDGRSARDGAIGGVAPRSDHAGAPTEASVTARREAGDGPALEARRDDPFDLGDPPRSVATSPTVGLFRPSVPVGTWVQAGDRVGVVDMLGIPQDVPSPIDGTLVEVFPSSGEAVEFGEAIAAVAPDPPKASATDDPDPASAAPAAEPAPDAPAAAAEQG